VSTSKGLCLSIFLKSSFRAFEPCEEINLFWKRKMYFTVF